MTVRLRLDHVGVAVDDLAGARAVWERLLGAEASPPEVVDAEGVRLSFVGVDNTRVELLESASDDSAIARYLARRPAGVHHLSFAIEGVSIDDWFEELRRRGVRVIGDAPGPGADGTRVFFVHPSATGGVLVEFSQRDDGHPRAGESSE